MMQRRQLRSTLVLLSPWLLGFGIFWAYPLLYALFLSFTKYRTLNNEWVWIGLANYSKLLHDDLFWQALLNTSIFVIGTVPFTMSFALMFAVALSRIERFKQFYRSSLFLPSITSIIVIALIYTNLYNAGGYLNTLARMIGLPVPKTGWLLAPNWALPAVMLMDIWISIGYYAVLFLAAIENIPRDYYEVAELEGSTRMQQFLSITLPALKPTLLFTIVLNTIHSFQIFNEIYVMTRGGPLNKTATLVYAVYENAFEKADGMGYACAIAYVLFFIIAIFSATEIRFLRPKTS